MDADRRRSLTPAIWHMEYCEIQRTRCTPHRMQRSVTSRALADDLVWQFRRLLAAEAGVRPKANWPLVVADEARRMQRSIARPSTQPHPRFLGWMVSHARNIRWPTSVRRGRSLSCTKCFAMSPHKGDSGITAAFLPVITDRIATTAGLYTTSGSIEPPPSPKSM